MVDQPVIDNAAVAAASLNRAPVVAARAQALDPRPPRPAARAPTVFGVDERASAPSGRPGPTASRCASSTTTTPSSPPTTRTRATTSRRSSPSPSTSAPDGAGRWCAASPPATRSRSTWCKAICLHKHKIDHVAHLGPSAAAGIGTLLGLDVETIFQAVGQALHTTTATRQSRKGEISTWKAHAPAFAGKMAVEAVDRAMRGETSPDADLRGRGRRHRLAARRPGRLVRGAAARRRRGQARASSTRTRRSTRPSTRRRRGSTSPASCTASTPSSRDPAQRRVDRAAHVSHHTHYVIGSGANDPQKYDPTASPRDARPLDPVHLHRRPAGRRLAPRRLVRARARRPRRTPSSCGTRSPRSRTRSGPAATTPDDPPRRPSAARVEITLDGRHGHRRRDRRRRRPPAGRPAVRPRAVHQQVPHPRRRRASADEEIERFLDAAAAPARARRRRAGPAQHPGRRRRARPAPPPRRDSSDAVLDRSPPAAEADPRSASASPPATMLRFPGAFNPLLGPADRGEGLRRASTSPAPCLGHDLGLPDIGLTTLTEVAGRGRADRPDDRPARRSSTPTPASASR